MGYDIAPADAAAHTCRREGCPRPDRHLPMVGGCDRCGRVAFTECLRFHAEMHRRAYPVTADFLVFAAELLERQAAEIAACRERLPSPATYPAARDNGPGIGDWRELPEAP